MATGKSRSEIQIHLRQLNGKRMVFSLLFFLALSFPTADSDARVTFASETLCGTGRATTANFIPKFVQSMEELSSNLNNSNNHFAVTNNTDPGTPPFFALIQCHEDLSRTDCLVCYAVSRTELPICLPRTSGRVFLDGCFLRYDNYSFFQEDVDPATDTKNCRSTVTNTNWNDFRGGFSEFDRSMVDLVENLTQSAVNNSGFGVMELNGVYGLAQCWKSLTTEQCRICMNKAKSEVVSCWGGEGRSMNAGCFFRYSTEKFYDNDPRADGGSSGTRRKTLVISVTTLFLGFIMTILIVIILCSRRKFKRRRNAKHGSVNVENFLKNHEFLAKRYSYLQVKKMTNTFEVKLGQGGFGIVYRGALTNGNLVAVKILSELKGNGEDFINEVASVGKTSHVNIVSLVGFCCEGHRRALIYDFMPNGSLEKFIYEQPSISNRQLGWKKLYEIAIGIARGLEYLHSGCNTRILHFDIKPHNILLDQDFSPKISDFGLAKLFPEKRSMISVSHMRGTPGYIAPELFSRNFGQVSHKSDVYSYGMMILEMVGGRKNVEVEVDHTSEIYFPHWIYKKVELDEDLGIHTCINDEENEMARKMIIVGLWCIQTNPLNRPTITKALEMLEGDLTSLDIPPKPYLMSSPSRSHGSSFID